MAVYDKYTEEQERFLKENAPNMSRRALTEFFNARFGTCKSEQAIKMWCYSRGYNSSSTGRFEKGCKNWMNGLSIEEIKKHYTEESFALKTKNAQLVNRTKHIGDEIIKSGEPWVIVSEDYSIPYHDRRYPKRRYVWEQAYGEIPKDHCIICLDGNKMNCNLDNLYCLPNKYKSIMARNKWFFKDKEMTLTAIKWCELHYVLKDGAYND